VYHDALFIWELRVSFHIDKTKLFDFSFQKMNSFLKFEIIKVSIIYYEIV